MDNEVPILLTGATGSQGGAAVDARGVELAKGDLEDVVSLQKALKGNSLGIRLATFAEFANRHANNSVVGP